MPEVNKPDAPGLENQNASSAGAQYSTQVKLLVLFSGYHRLRGSSIHGGVAFMKRPRSGSASSMRHFISQAISR